MREGVREEGGKGGREGRKGKKGRKEEGREGGTEGRMRGGMKDVREKQWEEVS